MGEWVETTLGELCRAGGGDIQTGPFGSQLHASDYVADGIPCVMPQNIGDNAIVERGIARIRQMDADRLARYLLRPDDIVYSRRGDVERRALVRPEQAGWLCGTGCLRVRLGSRADARFVSYYLGDPDVRSWIVRHAIGATMPNLNTSILGALPVRVPSLDEQCAIAAVLGAFDDKIAANEEIAIKLERLLEWEFRLVSLESVYRHVRLGEVAELSYGKALPATVRTNGNVPVYGGNGVSGRHDTALVARPGIIVGRKGANAGSVSWSPVPFWPIDTAFYVGPSEAKIPEEFLFWALRNAGLSGLVGDSAIPGLNRSIALSLPLSLPSDDEMNEFSRHVAAMVSFQTCLASESCSLVSVRDAVLPRLMSGQLRIKDAEKIVEDST